MVTTLLWLGPKLKASNYKTYPPGTSSKFIKWLLDTFKIVMNPIHLPHQKIQHTKTSTWSKAPFFVSKLLHNYLLSKINSRLQSNPKALNFLTFSCTKSYLFFQFQHSTTWKESKIPFSFFLLFHLLFSFTITSIKITTELKQKQQDYHHENCVSETEKTRGRWR